MIIDNIDNISKYNIVPQNIIKFIENLTISTPAGHYEIDNENFANIDIYEPKSIEDCKFEAHKKYIDIQIMLEGEEEIDCINTNGMIISEKYDEKRDVMFFKNPEKIPDKIVLSPFKFAYITPQEAHKPQIKTTSKRVKKVVVKIKL